MISGATQTYLGWDGDFFSAELYPGVAVVRVDVHEVVEEALDTAVLQGRQAGTPTELGETGLL